MALHHSFPEDYEELPYPQEYDYLWTEERYSKFDENGVGVLNPSWWFRQKEEAADRQGVTSVNPLLVAFVVGVTFSALLLLAPLISPLPRPKLQNDPMCGIPTGGQEECWWDCEILSLPEFAGQAIINPECLKDCFDQVSDTENRDTSCLLALLEDVTTKGTCDVDGNPAPILDIWGWSELANNCTLNVMTFQTQEIEYDYNEDGVIEDYDYNVTMLTKGTCSDDTEALFKKTACLNSLAEQPNIIKTTLELLVQYSCSEELFGMMPFSEFQFGRKRSHKDARTTTRLAPVTLVNVTAGTKTKLNYENTKHRYPWICSLRTRGVNSDHLCAVNLLAVPPNPTVIVGSAHCTYLCKDVDKNGVTLPSCCCVTRGQESCQYDTVKCGTDPVAVEMDGSDTEIICGEWQTGASVSGEEYNVVLPILEIVRSPAFDAKKLGPGGGGDIAVFKVDDGNLQNPRKNRIYPACLPPRDRSVPTKGVHSGWTKPPPLSFIEKYGSGFVPYYSDFFKQWHYSMNISERCIDPTVTQAFGVEIQFPSETYYPPATVCAKDATLQSCFSTGDSGSPLMVKEEKRPQRFFIEGILSFVKGCEQFSIGPSTQDKTTAFQLLQNSENPAAYTKLSCFLPWVAEQYGLSYEPDYDESCTQGTGPATPFNSTHPYDAVCRQNKGTDLFGKEHPCIFPFYYRGKGPYHECTLFEEENFVYPVFRCPVRNITTKFPGTDINHFEKDLGLTDGYCIDIPAAVESGCDLSSLDDCDFRLLNPALKCDPLTQVPPFSSCKNDCPGVRSLGIIGAGAVLFGATAAAGLQTLAVAGIGTGALAAGGGVATRASCSPPFCVARSGQCCLLRPGRRGRLVCPRSC